jgi:hypothetical protein
MARGASTDTSEHAVISRAEQDASVGQPGADREQELQAPFRTAWSDLGTRLDTGYQNLKAMKDVEPLGTQQHWKLVVKLQGLDNAIELYELLKERQESTEDPAATWRTYTDAVRQADKNLNTGNELTDIAYREGLNLGIEYQHGHGPDLDPR